MNKERFKQLLRKNSRRMIRKPIFWSCFLHFIIIVSASVNLAFLKIKKNDMLDNPPVFIDLTKVEIDDVTNLPAEVKKEKEVKKEEPKVEPPKPVYTKPKEESKPTPPKPKEIEVTKVKQEKVPTPKSEGAKLEVPVPEKKKVEKPKPKPKKKEVKPEKETIDDLSSLLSSIEETKDAYQPTNYKSEEKAVSKGIKGGIGGDLSRKISITDKDALISRIRSCWNVEAGVKGAESMIVEITVALNNDGSVKKVEIVDMRRFKSDYAFRTIAESARRAIYVCERRGENSPFYILAKKYPDTFDVWQDLRLRFSPLEGVGF
ncbi:MAG: hypothetical protein BWY78_00600 [Alphaproteobacteria bacterium ADurb.Bin438]|nr:MAG: hypothetical protein BWY78_00600 [Alphaproteobacteria bacterium ADurb.Bin438]